MASAVGPQGRRAAGRARAGAAALLVALGLWGTAGAAAVPEAARPGLPAGVERIRLTVADTVGVPAVVPSEDASPRPAGASSAEAGPAVAESEYFFYRGQTIGSMSLVHPLRMIVNGSYGILQLDNQNRHIWDFPYGNGVDNVWLNVTHPFTAIHKTDGWREFAFREILPFSTNTKDARYWPNYTQHLIGGGMSYRMVAEWYDFHGFAHPRAWSFGTMAVYHFWNEVVENGDFKGYTTDPIADLLVFDPLGMVLFNHDGVAGFFGRTLQMSDWSYQPAYDPHRRTLENNGQNFAIKAPLPWTQRWRLFYYYGTHGELGLSRRWASGASVSFAGGFRAENLKDLGHGVRTVDLVPTFGVFYDVDNSLLASVLISNSVDHRVRLNLYPGLFGRGFAQPGFFLSMTENRQVTGGITIGGVPNLPVGIGARLARGREEPVTP